MKRNNLVTAVLAGIAGIAGIAGSAQAVNVNPDGLGQVLIYPYYTTNNGMQTLLSVVNTTDEAKAVKVRFLESINSREVLDFNLYMSAYDVWTAALYDNAGTPTMVTADSSCTVPYFFGNGNGLGSQPFLNFAYSGANTDGGSTSIVRASEGHFEIIEMGSLLDITNGSATAATHVLATDPAAINFPQSLPANCAQLVAAWSVNVGVNGYWLDDTSIDISAPTGGLFGGAALVNANEGTMFSYDAKAINGFWDDAVPAGLRHTNPGDELPSLTSGDNLVANLVSDQGVPVQLTYGESIEAVSAVFMHNFIMNEFAIVDVLAAQSEWIMTFPTKRFYTDPAFAIATPPVAPFTMALGAGALSCEDVNIAFWDREEKPTTPGSGGPIVSPKPPPGVDPDAFVLCTETNVIRFDEDEEVGINAASPIVGTDGFDSLKTFAMPNGLDAGWARIDMATTGQLLVGTERLDSQGMLGLPVVGYWLEAFTNGTLEGGSVLANYGGTFEHKGTRAMAQPQ